MGSIESLCVFSLFFYDALSKTNRFFIFRGNWKKEEILSTKLLWAEQKKIRERMKEKKESFMNDVNICVSPIWDTNRMENT